MPRVKASKVQMKENTIQEAMRDYRSGKFPRIRKAAAYHKVDFTTLPRRLSGTKPAPQVHPESALMIPKQEEDIVHSVPNGPGRPAVRTAAHRPGQSGPPKLITVQARPTLSKPGNNCG
jgi:hypothetical protein